MRIGGEELAGVLTVADLKKFIAEHEAAGENIDAWPLHILNFTEGAGYVNRIEIDAFDCVDGDPDADDATPIYSLCLETKEPGYP